MVSWTGDGLVSGYDPTTKKHKQGLFHLAVAGSVDVNGGTRLHYNLNEVGHFPGSTYPNAASYPMTLRITATMNFSAADFAATPNRDLGMAAILVKASKFAAVNPTPQMIFDAAVDASSKGSHYAEEGSSVAVPVSATMQFTNAQMDANTKYWLMVYPANISNPASAWSKSNYDPIGNLNTNGRAISIWTNRTPAAPTITSPPTGSVFPIGSNFPFAFTPNDPDALTPNDSLRSNADLAGVEVQYAPASTTDNPNPEWKYLPYHVEDGSASGFAEVTAMASSGTEKISILRNLGFPISAAIPRADMEAHHGRLPVGDWQVRVRVANWGHPYPNLVTPAAVWPPSQMWAQPYFPADLLSPWSEPVRISIPSQTPPPIPLSPGDNEAVQEGETVRLEWQYRNTAVPP